MAETAYERIQRQLSYTQARLLVRIADNRLVVGGYYGARRNTYRALAGFGLVVPGDIGDIAELTRRGRGLVKRMGAAS